MRRREFITLVGGAAATVAWLPLARAQQGERMRRIGVLFGLPADDPQGKAIIAVFLQALQQLGWTDGRNVRIDIRSAAGNVDDARKYAAELVALAPRRSGGWAEETLSDTLPVIRNIAISG